MSILHSAVLTAQSPQAQWFTPEKMSAKIALPATLQIWESTKAQLIFYKDQRGGTLPSALRLAARLGAPILVQQCGNVSAEYPRFYPLVIGVGIEHLLLLGECVSQTGQDAAEALAYWALRGLRRGRDMGWERI
jgi:hypothetical protein